ncbi:MAG: UbiX family flavin prenyltransferase [Alistipes sp.]|nr:UbiX family flavin prenyltransferase [Alistipes sp.]
MKIVVAITAASGGIYARQLLEQLIGNEGVEKVALIFSANASAVLAAEGVELPQSQKIVSYDNSNLFASPASGSADWDAMVIVPSSVGTLGRIASGVSQTLIERAADVMLKERRKLLLLLRETPLSLIHLRNMTTLTEAGAIIVPACPSFYSKPEDIDQLCSTVTERVVSLLGISAPHYKWGE